MVLRYRAIKIKGHYGNRNTFLIPRQFISIVREPGKRTTFPFPRQFIYIVRDSGNRKLFLVLLLESLSIVDSGQECKKLSRQKKGDVGI